ncbi:MAG TPA: polyphenol oxidase family protein [Thermoleophilaceae bacterium]|nr:polyphenol oxidase family protein [Thermoleophilaceae bacterium]
MRVQAAGRGTRAGAAREAASVIAARLPGAAVRFSTRSGGVSEGPYASLNLGAQTADVPERVVENRRLASVAAGLAPEAVALGQQVHGIEIDRWEARPAGAFTDLEAPRAEVDGHVTTLPGLGLLVQVADCLPVALASADQVAMIHCGWRGLAGGIVARAVAEFDWPPAAVVGPGIGRCCFEVGPEVLDEFADVEGAADGRMLDLRMVAEARLRAAGVERVEHVDLCTSCRDDMFFSHRRDVGVTGRQCGIVWRT